MKTPEESKCGMECIRSKASRVCVKTENGQCPRCEQLVEESLVHIHKLESTTSQVSKALCGKENATLDEILQAVSQLKSRLTQADAERNAAVADIRNAKWLLCHVCKNYYRPDPAVRHYVCKEFGEFSDFLTPSDCAEEGYDFPSLCGKFIWRGVCEENTHDQHSL